MNATPSELLMRNFNEIFIELDPVRRAALVAESFTEDCLWIHPGGRVVGRDSISEAASEIRRHFPEYRYTVANEIQTIAQRRDLQVGKRLASHSTTQERTSPKSAMDACHGSTRSSTRNCCFIEGRKYRARIV